MPITDAAPPPAGIALAVASGLPLAEMLRLRDLLCEHPGEVPVTLEMRLPDRTVRIAARDNCKIAWNPDVAAAIEEILGSGTVRRREKREPLPRTGGYGKPRPLRRTHFACRRAEGRAFHRQLSVHPTG